MNVEICLSNSLCKLSPGGAVPGREVRISVLRGECVSFQVCFRTDVQWGRVRLEARSPLTETLRLRSVELVPVDWFPPEIDADAVGCAPGLFPDLLREIPDGMLSSVAGQWRSVWVSLLVPDSATPSEYPVEVLLHITALDGESQSFAAPAALVAVIAAQLPPQRLKHTDWLHTDSLADYYEVEVFSPEYWRIVERFVRNAASHGVNMLFTPLFTPPLDTEVGGERKTVQLVEIGYDGESYSFDFSRLTRWVEMARACGVRYFEFPHFFTQWGAGFTPKIMVREQGRIRRFFGWDVPASAPEYAAFLDVFLPALTAYCDRNGLRDAVYFHCSDEPRIEHAEAYGRAIALLRRHLEGFRMIDALSRIEFYRTGLIDIPVPCERSLEAFAAEALPERWTYYCCEPFSGYPNRFIHMNSGANRILGMLLYRYGMDGFLHWGYNFYYTRLSRGLADPYQCTTAGGAFPAGDGFLVYPGRGGVPEDSVRGEVFREALQDLRVLQCLERYMPREEICAILDAAAPGGRLTMTDFPRGDTEILKLRERIVSLIESLVS